MSLHAETVGKVAFVSRIRLLKVLLLLYLPRPCILWDAGTRLNNACDPCAAVGAALKFSALDCNYVTELNDVRRGFILCLTFELQTYFIQQLHTEQCSFKANTHTHLHTVENVSHHLFIRHSRPLV